MIVIPTYEFERQDGIAQTVATQGSIAFASVLAPSEKDVEQVKKEFKTMARKNVDIDLYPINTVLVTSGWNKNTDVFTAQELWMARATPEDKQFNYEHNEADIIGHITDCVVVDDNFDIVEDGNSLPDIFHIVTSAVLYTHWENEELQARMDSIIAEIQEGKWFVSMEALFTDFDYAVIDKEGRHSILALHLH